ncbi:MAG TPA: ABC transporter substrate-binding protein, partial [Chloroflexota bacterium]
MKRAILLPLILVCLGAACASPAARNSSPSTSGGPAEPARTLAVASATEPKSLAARTIGQTATGGLIFARRLFNADLALLDDQSNSYPYLAEALPQLNTDSWKLFPNGEMETTYHLKPNLTWHDGTPLTADDFVFSWQVYATPDLGQASSLPIKLIANVEAPDSRTVLIHWAQPFAAAGALQSLGNNGPLGLPPLPRSILGSSFESGAATLIANPYWTAGYVGLGPYHLDRWEPGAFLEASAFDRHVLGVPRINRIKLVFMLDSNVALASMLAREVQMASDNGLPLAQTSSLLRQWPAGSAVMVPSYLSWLAAHFQNRPDFVSPPALRDVRVRRALAHAVDRDGINDSLFESQLGIADTMFPLTSDLGRAAAAAATKYPFDLVRSAQLMADAGFTRPAAEPYLGPDGERLTVEVRTGSASDVATQTALASGWRQAGFEFQEVVVPPAQSQDTRVKASFPGLQVGLVGVGEAAIDGMGSANIPGPSNQWRGRAWDG